MRAEAFGQIGLLPHNFYELEFNEYLLVRTGFIESEKNKQKALRFQTALICECLVGGGKGRDYVMNGWQIDEQDGKGLTADDVKAILKQKRERDALKRLKNG